MTTWLAGGEISAGWPGPEGATMTREPTRFHVDRVWDREEEGGPITHEVQITLASVEWRHLLSDVCRGITRARQDGRPILSSILSAGETTGLRHMDAVTRLIHVLRTPEPSWLLGTDEAIALARAILRAAEEPATEGDQP